MTAFDRAWALLKVSASKREYQQPSLGEIVSPQDIDLKPDIMRDFTGGVWLSARDPQSFSSIHPSAMARKLTDWKEGEELGAVGEQMITDAMKRTGAHEGTHQAIHSIEPSLRRNTKAHEYGAYIGEFAQDPIHDPKLRLRHLLGHSQLDDAGFGFEGEGIQEIIDHLADVGSHPDTQSKTMGMRARENAQELMEEEENEERWYRLVHGLIDTTALPFDTLGE